MQHNVWSTVLRWLNVDMKISIETFPNAVVITFLSLAQTFLLMGHIDVGDGVFYSQTFSALSGVSILDGYQAFQDGLGASEFFSYLIFYVAAQVIDYEGFIYLSNLAIAVSIYLVYKKYEKGILWYLCTVPLNYYFLVLCFGAQRLKLGLLLLFLAVFVAGRVKSRALVVLSLFSHFQVVIVLVAERIRSFFSGVAKLPLFEITLFGAFCLGLFFYVPVLQLKVLSYVLERGDVNYLTFFGSFFIALYATKFDVGVVVEFLFFFALIFLIGESRVNILVFFVLWRVIFLARATPALVALPISVYLWLKGIGFIGSILAGGSGFSEV